MKKRPLRSKLVHQFEKPLIFIEVWQDSSILLHILEDYHIFTSLEESINYLKNNYEI